MTNRRSKVLVAVGAVVLVLVIAAVAAWPGTEVSHHPVQPSALGVRTTSGVLERVVDDPGPIEVETIASADWQVPRSGLINLEHAHAKQAGLTDVPEPIRVFFHVLRHPTRGTFIVDTGVERAQRDVPDEALVRGLVASVMKAETMKIHLPLGEWLAQMNVRLEGVFLTHLHLDHIMGMRDVPDSVPVYAGPGETTSRSFQNVFVNGITDTALAGKAPIQEWQFPSETNDSFDGVIDVFGDGSLFAISVPGHTPGTTAYLARTPRGPVLLAGDASHTAWGWEHDVEPGTFSADPVQSAKSFSRLRRFAAAHPTIDVRLGHQALAPAADAATAAH